MSNRLSTSMTLGPIMLDVAATELTAEDRERLMHPLVGGGILFTRNYQTPDQLAKLVSDIHQLRDPPLIVAVDQEGGRVQRFRDQFQLLPAMAKLGELYDQNPQKALDASRKIGWLMATELRVYGIDLSFAPVLDLGHPVSSVIGDRAFHQDATAVIQLANSWINGMSEAGMASVGKHFPGHGSVAGDSHHVLPVDKRPYEQIAATDLDIFKQVMNRHLDAVMVAHVVYSAVDEKPAGFSEFWIQQVLREKLGFDGLVFTDDLSMGGAAYAGNHLSRSEAALAAGCDMLLICNNPDAADDVLDNLVFSPVTGWQQRLDTFAHLCRTETQDIHFYTKDRSVFSSEKWLEAQAMLRFLAE